MTDYLAITRGHYDNGDVWSFGWHITSTQSRAALLTTWSNAWIAAWTNGTYGIDTFYPTTTVMTGWTVYELNGTMNALFRSDLTNPQPGTSSDNGLPNLTAITVSKRSPTVAKYGRGKCSLPAPVEGIVVNGSYTGASMTRVKTAVDSVLSAINADGSTVFVFPRVETKGHILPYTKTVITSLLVALKVGTQRRREDPEQLGYV